MRWHPAVADRGDVLLIARFFAEFVAAREFTKAEEMVRLAEEVASGGWAYLGSPHYDRGGRLLCAVLTRRGTGCEQPAGADGLCGTHRRLLRATVPPDKDER